MRKNIKYRGSLELGKFFAKPLKFVVKLWFLDYIDKKGEKDQDAIRVWGLNFFVSRFEKFSIPNSEKTLELM